MISLFEGRIFINVDCKGHRIPVRTGLRSERNRTEGLSGLLGPCFDVYWFSRKCVRKALMRMAIASGIYSHTDATRVQNGGMVVRKRPRCLLHTDPDSGQVDRVDKNDSGVESSQT